MIKKAIISGITGQDGSYLADLLLKEGFDVVGLTRDPSLLYQSNIGHLEGKIELKYTPYDFASLSRIIKQEKPGYIYNLCGQSYVLKSWDMIDETISSAGIIPCHFLKAISEIDRDIRYFQASSSEIFEPDNGDGLSEECRILPRTPYGCAKSMAHNMVVSFRQNYGIFAVNGILFNHESPRRRNNFLSKKIIREAIKIKHGKSSQLSLGNLDVKRDWGYAPDYMLGAYKMMLHDKAEDFILATGKMYSVLDMVKVVFSHLALNYEKYVKVDQRFVRPFEPKICRGIPIKAQKVLNWEAQTDFVTMLQIMIDEELRNPE